MKINDSIDCSLNLGKFCQISSKVPKFTDCQTQWKPLVIIIPLRLGLNSVNTEYIEQIKVQMYSLIRSNSNSFV